MRLLLLPFLLLLVHIEKADLAAMDEVNGLIGKRFQLPRIVVRVGQNDSYIEVHEEIAVPNIRV